MNIKHKFLYILRVSQQVVLETRRRSGNLRVYSILQYLCFDLCSVSKLLLIKIYLGLNIFLYITTRLQSLTFLPSVGLRLSKLCSYMGSHNSDIPEKAGSIADFISSIIFIQIRILFYLLYEFRNLRRQEPRIYFCTEHRDDLNRSCWFVSLFLNHTCAIYYVVFDCQNLLRNDGVYFASVRYKQYICLTYSKVIHLDIPVYTTKNYAIFKVTSG